MDVWVVDGVDEEALVESHNWLYFVPHVSGTGQLQLVHRDVAPIGRSAPRGRWRPTVTPD